jgi:hypothetical protein
MRRGGRHIDVYIILPNWIDGNGCDPAVFPAISQGA